MAISTYISYAGPFELLLDRDTVIHYIEVCSYSNWIGNPSCVSSGSKEICWC